MSRNQPFVFQRCIGAALLVLITTLVGCDTVEPRYAASRVTFDPGLVGWWQEVPKADAATDGAEPAAPPPPFEIVARKANTDNGLFSGGEIGGESAVPTPGSRPTPALDAYIVRLPRDPAQPSGGPPDRSNELWAVMLQAGEHRLVGIQARLPKGGPFTAPYHVVVRIERDGDQLHVWSSKHSIVWMPGVQMLDPAPPPPRDRVPSMDELNARKEGGMFLTLDAARLLEVYSCYAGEPTFWQDQPTTFRRVQAKAQP